LKNFSLPELKAPLGIHAKALSQKEIYSFMTSAIAPRPIAWVSTISPEGKGNLAPFSFFNAVATQPPTVMICIAREKNGKKKDTLINIEKTKEFVVNSAHRWLVDAIDISAQPFEYGVDEAEKAGLSLIDSVCIQPKRIQQSAWQFECQAVNMIEVGNPLELGSVTCIFGQIVYFHIYPEFFHLEKVQTEKLDLIARADGKDYIGFGERISAKK
jgi:flavin reductase (DIM6/NTAB) family NADH-FMN oxidoreductase RutF